MKDADALRIIIKIFYKCGKKVCKNQNFDWSDFSLTDVKNIIDSKLKTLFEC